jgi:hypothetical protein
MDFQITAAGVAAAIAAGENGPKISLTSFKLGTGAGYTPLPQDTALHGATVYSGPINNYYAGNDPDTVIYELDVPASEGPYQWGEAGIYMPDGTLFALAVRPTTRAKDAGILTRIQATMVFAGATSVITFPVMEIAQAKLIELATVNQLNVPSVMDANCYMTKTFDDSTRLPIVALRRDNDFWGFPSHTAARVLGTVEAGSTVTRVNSSAIGNLTKVDAAPPGGKFLIQMLTGALRGTVRQVAASGNNYVESDAWGSIPAVGTQFVVLQSNNSILQSVFGKLDAGGLAPYALITYVDAMRASLNNAFIQNNTTGPAVPIQVRYDHGDGQMRLIVNGNAAFSNNWPHNITGQAAYAVNAGAANTANSVAGITKPASSQLSGNQVHFGWVSNRMIAQVDSSYFGGTWPIDIQGYGHVFADGSYILGSGASGDAIRPNLAAFRNWVFANMDVAAVNNFWNASAATGRPYPAGGVGTAGTGCGGPI